MDLVASAESGRYRLGTQRTNREWVASLYGEAVARYLGDRMVSCPSPCDQHVIG